MSPQNGRTCTWGEVTIHAPAPPYPSSCRSLAKLTSHSSGKRVLVQDGESAAGGCWRYGSGSMTCSTTDCRLACIEGDAGELNLLK
mmetsp:Transcript_85733/g.171246  ORF Transcript_85733/g.171246 Transcript_85733/m.171246 type:complete len:86 (-) Transcript_85733:1441-1698(-)